MSKRSFAEVGMETKSLQRLLRSLLPGPWREASKAMKIDKKKDGLKTVRYISLEISPLSLGCQWETLF